MKKEKTVLTPPVASQPKDEEAPINATPPSIRSASKEEFDKVKRKVFALHDSLFRRLADHDRER